MLWTRKKISLQCRGTLQIEYIMLEGVWNILNLSFARQGCRRELVFQNVYECIRTLIIKETDPFLVLWCEWDPQQSKTLLSVLFFCLGRNEMCQALDVSNMFEYPQAGLSGPWVGGQVLETEELRMVLETILDPISDPGRKYYGTDLVMGLISAYFIKPALIVDQSMGLKKNCT